jgi:hypothetical protein
MCASSRSKEEEEKRRGIHTDIAPLGEEESTQKCGNRLAETYNKWFK